MTDRLIKEAIRYLGYGRHAVDDQTLALIADSFGKLQEAAGRKSVYRMFDLVREDEETVEFASIKVNSKSLGRNLRGCNKIILFAATLGIKVDQLITRASLTDMAGAVILQACAAAMLEEYCDECQEKIAEEIRSDGYYLRPRFSPGYGDFSIAHQTEVIRVLDCAKKIGLTLTKSCMMSPTKSVTAVIGASCTDEHCHQEGCEVCEKKDCTYRRDTV